MTGLELLEGLSFVDERYIAEAETAYLKRGTPWMKWVSAAACLCILLVGAYAYSQLSRPMEGIAEAPAADMPADAPAATIPAADEPAAGAPKEEKPAAEEAQETGAIPDGELQHVPAVILQVVSVTEDGFTAIVGDHADADCLETGMEVTVVIDPAMVPGSEEKDAAAIRMETELTEGMLLHITDGAYDAGTGTLYVDGIIPAE